MSKLFYDHLLELNELEKFITEIVETQEEKDELWILVDEIVHHRILGCILDHLPKDRHEHFVDRYKSQPYNEDLINYINEKIEHDIEVKIREEIARMEEELLRELTQ